MIRRLPGLLLALALCWPVSSWAAIAFVTSQSAICVDNNVTTTITCALPGNATSGNVIVAVVGYAGATVTTGIVFTDNQSGSYSTAASLLNSPATTNGGAIGTGTVTSTATPTITATISGTTPPSNKIMCVLEYSGVNTTTRVDVSSANGQLSPGTGADNITSGAAVTTENNEMIVGGLFDVQGITQTINAGTSPNAFTDRANKGSGANLRGMCEEFAQTTAASIAATAGFAVGSNDDTVAFMVALKNPAGAAPLQNSSGFLSIIMGGR